MPKPSKTTPQPDLSPVAQSCPADDLKAELLNLLARLVAQQILNSPLPPPALTPPRPPKSRVSTIRTQPRQD